MGPGEAIVNMAMVKSRVSRFGKTSLAVVIHNFNDPFCARLPVKIDVGHTVNITFPVNQNCLLDTKPVRIGVRDSFGRIHWAPKRDLILAHRDWDGYKAGDHHK
jgi:hypothetical protein